MLNLKILLFFSLILSEVTVIEDEEEEHKSTLYDLFKFDFLPLFVFSLLLFVLAVCYFFYLKNENKEISEKTKEKIANIEIARDLLIKKTKELREKIIETQGLEGCELFETFSICDDLATFLLSAKNSLVEEINSVDPDLHYQQNIWSHISQADSVLLDFSILCIDKELKVSVEMLSSKEVFTEKLEKKKDFWKIFKKSKDLNKK